MNIKNYNQEQLLRYYDILTEEEKCLLNDQINSIDFALMAKLYKNSFIDNELDTNKIANLKILKKEDVTDEDRLLGEDIIKNNQYAILLMAGGFGSRLGYNMPKGCLELNINNNKTSLFEIFINQIKEANTKYNSILHLFIMTSNANNGETIQYFEDNNYFNYKDNIHIFVQDELPILDLEGNLVLKNKYEVLFGPNGNGDVFNALKRNKLIDYMNEIGIKYVLFTSIDNPLANLIDADFIGTSINNNYSLASKTLSKTNEDDKGYIYCKYNNKPFVLPSKYINKELTNIKDEDGNYLYREKNIVYHLISIDNIKLFSNIELPYHRAFKNNKFLDQDGNLITTNEQNSYKFERFIYDAFFYADDMLLYRVNENEFSPIKNEQDIEKVEKILNKNRI